MSSAERNTFGPLVGASTFNNSFTNFVINQTTDRWEVITQAPEAATITHLGFRYGARVGTPVEHLISLQGLDTSGNPDGTILGGGSPASGSFTPPADASWDGTFQWVALTNSIALTRGQFIALVISPVGTPDGSNSSSFTSLVSSWQNAVVGFPLNIQNDNGSRTRQTSRGPWGMKSSSRAYGVPIQSVHVTNISTTSEQAVTFTFDASWGATHKIAGVQVICRSSAAKSVVMTLYSGTTALQTATIDMDVQVTADAFRVFDFYFTDTTLTELTHGSTYRIGFAPQEASAGFCVLGAVVASADDLTAFPGGNNFTLATRASGGATAWTDATTTRAAAGLILDDWAEPNSDGASANLHGGIHQ